MGATKKNSYYTQKPTKLVVIIGCDSGLLSAKRQGKETGFPRMTEPTERSVSRRNTFDGFDLFESSATLPETGYLLGTAGGVKMILSPMLIPWDSNQPCWTSRAYLAGFLDRYLASVWLGAIVSILMILPEASRKAMERGNHVFFIQKDSIRGTG